MKKAKTVDEYIAMAPEGVRGKLRELRKIIREIAPEAEESISYGMPGYDKGRVCWFGISKNHIGLYLRPPIIEQHMSELAGYGTTKSAVHIPLEGKLPVSLVKKLVKARMRMNEEMGEIG